nr:hypothetical protein K-LCC10_0321 [Kaumoebavirus]
MSSLKDLVRVYHTYTSLVWEILHSGNIVSKSFVLPSDKWGMVVRSGNKETCRIVWVDDGKVVRGTLKEFLGEGDQCFLLHLLEMDSDKLKSVQWRAKCWEGRKYDIMRGDDPRQFVLWLAFMSLSDSPTTPTTPSSGIAESVLYYAQLPFTMVSSTYSYFFPDTTALRENYLAGIEKEFGPQENI